MLNCAQAPLKQLVSRPHSIRIDDVCLAVVGDLANAPLAVQRLYLGPVEPSGLPGQAHDTTELVQRDLRLEAERRERVAEVERVLGVPVEVRSNREPRRRYAVDHGTIPKDRQVETVAVERHQLRPELGNSR